MERHWMRQGSSTVSVPQTDIQYRLQLQTLERWFILRGERAEILYFLEIYPFLVPLLFESYAEIERYFSHPLVYLGVATDPEEFTIDQLTVSIATALNPEDAVHALNEFDKAWWLNSLKRAQGKLCITLEFV
jgi:hypothetical protein